MNYNTFTSNAKYFEGYNLWFQIEIVTFYGYQLAAILFILESTIRSNFGLMNKDHISDRYQYDMIHYHLQELHWMSFIVIRILVNALICWYNYEAAVLGPLMYSMYALLTIHILEFVFQRQFFHQNRRVHLHSKWIWGIKIVAYPIILYIYNTTIELENEKLVNVSR